MEKEFRKAASAVELSQGRNENQEILPRDSVRLRVSDKELVSPPHEGTGLENGAVSRDNPRHSGQDRVVDMELRSLEDRMKQVISSTRIELLRHLEKNKKDFRSLYLLRSLFRSTGYDWSGSRCRALFSTLLYALVIAFAVGLALGVASTPPGAFRFLRATYIWCIVTNTLNTLVMAKFGGPDWFFSKVLPTYCSTLQGLRRVEKYLTYALIFTLVLLITNLSIWVFGAMIKIENISSMMGMYDMLAQAFAINRSPAGVIVTGFVFIGVTYWWFIWILAFGFIVIIVPERLEQLGKDISKSSDIDGHEILSLHGKLTDQVSTSNEFWQVFLILVIVSNLTIVLLIAIFGLPSAYADGNVWGMAMLVFWLLSCAVFPLGIIALGSNIYSEEEVLLRAIASVDPQCFREFTVRDVVNLVDKRDVALRLFTLRIDWKIVAELAASISSLALILFQFANPETEM